MLTITRFATTFEDADIDDYVNHTNSAVFWGRAVKAGKMTSISDRGVDIDGRRMRQLQYQIKFGTLLPTGNWTVDLLDHGSKYFEVGAVSTLTDFQTKQGNPTTGNLNGLGFALAAGAPEVYLNFNLMETANFNDLKIGPTTWF